MKFVEFEDIKKLDIGYIFVLIPHLPFYPFGYSFPSENATLNYTKKRTETGR